MQSFRSYAFVIIQFLCIFLLVQNSTNIYQYPLAFFLVIIGITVLIAAVLEMKKSKLSVMPDIKNDATLITSGIYHYIRHPMYTGVLLVCLGLLLTNLSLGKAILYGLLIAVLLAKVSIEEQLLTQHFHQYKIYTQKTKRLIPWIF